MHMWQPGDNLQKSVLSPSVGLRDQIRSSDLAASVLSAEPSHGLSISLSPSLLPPLSLSVLSSSFTPPFLSSSLPSFSF